MILFQPFYLFVAYRYLRSQRDNRFISFSSLASVIGIMLGVGVLIAVLSVMNGFSREIRIQMLSGTPHMTIAKIGGSFRDWQSLRSTLMQEPDILGVAPFIQAQALLKAPQGHAQGVIVYGIDPLHSQSVYPALKTLQQGSIDALVPQHYGVLLGHVLAKNLGLQVGDTISLIVPEASVGPAGIMPRMKRFTIRGIFSIGTLYDDKQIFIHLQDADILFKMRATISGLQLRVADELTAPRIAHHLYQKLDQQYWITDWSTNFGSFFKALHIQKTVMTFILLLIIAVAAFNLVSSLVMIVAEKNMDIAILRTLGASRKAIMTIFIAQGLMIGFIGTLCGVLFGVFLASHVTAWVDRLQAFFGMELVSQEIYLIGFLPSEIHSSDIIMIASSAMLMCFIATIYPAFRAASIQPAEALRYA